MNSAKMLALVGVDAAIATICIVALEGDEVRREDRLARPVMCELTRRCTERGAPRVRVPKLCRIVTEFAEANMHLGVDVGAQECREETNWIKEEDVLLILL